MSNELVYIWSKSSGAFWRPGGNGYTLNRQEAGTFVRAIAERIVSASPEKDEIREIEVGDCDLLLTAKSISTLKVRLSGDQTFYTVTRISIDEDVETEEAGEFSWSIIEKFKIKQSL